MNDARGVDLLIPLLNDEDVDYIVPWSLAKSGTVVVLDPLLFRQIETILRYECWRSAPRKLKVREALPRLRELLEDDGRSNVGDRTTVASDPVCAGVARLQAAAQELFFPEGIADD